MSRLTTWTTALRSGAWPQTRGALGKLLRDDDTCHGGLCCLGVLAVVEGRVLVAMGLTYNELHLYPSGGEVQGLLNADLFDGDDTLMTQRIFSDANDTGATFGQIAELAELILDDDLQLKPGLNHQSVSLLVNPEDPNNDWLGQVRTYVKETTR